MKTAVSMPDDVYAAASQEAQARGVSRSALVTDAVREYLARREGESITRRLNEVLAREGEDESNVWAARAGRDRLSRSADDW